LSYYAATGVNAQAFVRVLFGSGELTKQYQYLVGQNSAVAKACGSRESRRAGVSERPVSSLYLL
jgi:hypothetical protein